VRKHNQHTLANEPLGLNAKERAEIKRDVEAAFGEVLKALRIDTERDHNTRETAKRVARMYVDEIFRGRFHPMPKITEFPNTRKLDEVYTTGPISVRSACSHHFVPIVGECWIGVIPNENLIGLSKFNRLTEWVMARPQIQEEAAVQLTDLIESLIKPRGLAVVIRAKHMCLTLRGVKEHNCEMTTSIMRGIFRESARARNEFLELIK
jgi:GTP cyclohydrolase I